jgi:hypothetical protein
MKETKEGNQGFLQPSFIKYPGFLPLPNVIRNNINICIYIIVKWEIIIRMVIQTTKFAQI